MSSKVSFHEHVPLLFVPGVALADWIWANEAVLINVCDSEAIKKHRHNLGTEWAHGQIGLFSAAEGRCQFSKRRESWTKASEGTGRRRSKPKKSRLDWVRC